MISEWHHFILNILLRNESKSSLHLRKTAAFFDTRKSDSLTKIIRSIIRHGSDIRFHKVDFSMRSTTKQVSGRHSNSQVSKERSYAHTMKSSCRKFEGIARARIQVYIPGYSVKKKRKNTPKSHNTRASPL